MDFTLADDRPTVMKSDDQSVAINMTVSQLYRDAFDMSKTFIIGKMEAYGRSASNISTFTADRPAKINVKCSVKQGVESESIEVVFEKDFSDLQSVSSVSSKYSEDECRMELTSEMVKKLPHELVARYLFDKVESVVEGSTSNKTPDYHAFISNENPKHLIVGDLKTTRNEDLHSCRAKCYEGMYKYAPVYSKEFNCFFSGIGINLKFICYTDNLIIKNEVLQKCIDLFALGIHIQELAGFQELERVELERIDLELPRPECSMSLTESDVNRWRESSDLVHLRKTTQNLILQKSFLKNDQYKKDFGKCEFIEREKESVPKTWISNKPIALPLEGDECLDHRVELHDLVLENLFMLDELIFTDATFEKPQNSNFDSNLDPDEHKEEILSAYHGKSSTLKKWTIYRNVKGRKVKTEVKDEELLSRFLEKKEAILKEYSGRQTLKFDYKTLKDDVFGKPGMNLAKEQIYEMSMCKEGVKPVDILGSDELWYHEAKFMTAVNVQLAISRNYLGPSLRKLKGYQAWMFTHCVAPDSHIFYKILFKGRPSEITTHWLKIHNDWYISKHCFSTNKDELDRESNRLAKFISLRGFCEEFFKRPDSVQNSQRWKHVFSFCVLCSYKMKKLAIDNLSLIRYCFMESTTLESRHWKVFEKTEPVTRSVQEMWIFDILKTMCEKIDACVKTSDPYCHCPFTGEKIEVTQMLQYCYLHFCHLFPSQSKMHQQAKIILKTLSYDECYEYIKSPEAFHNFINEGQTLVDKEGKPLQETEETEKFKKSHETYNHFNSEGNPDSVGKCCFDSKLLSSLGLFLSNKIKKSGMKKVLQRTFTEIKRMDFNTYTTTKVSTSYRKVTEEERNEAKIVSDKLTQLKRSKNHTKRTKKFIEKGSVEGKESLINQLQEQLKKYQKEIEEEKIKLEKVESPSDEREIIVKKTYCIIEFLKKDWEKKPICMIKELLRMLKELKIIITQFAKKQPTGSREIFILQFHIRMLMAFCETFFKCVAMELEGETISTPDKKTKIPSEIESIKSRWKESGFTCIDSYNSSDLSKFSQNLTYSLFSCFTVGLFSIFDEDEKKSEKDELIFEPYSMENLCLNVYSSMIHKKIHISEMDAKFYDNLEKQGERDKKDNYTMFCEQNPNKDVSEIRKLLTSNNKKYDRINCNYSLTTGMMQGICQVLASVIHCSVIEQYMSVVRELLKNLNMEGFQIRYTTRYTCSSDDSLEWIGVAIKPDSDQNGPGSPAFTAAKNRVLAFVKHFLYKIVDFKKLFGLKLSFEKSTIAGNLPEFNSIFFVNKSPVIPFIKYVISPINGLGSNTAMKRSIGAFSDLNEMSRLGIKQSIIYRTAVAMKRHAEFLVLGYYYEEMKHTFSKSNEVALFMMPLLPDYLQGVTPFLVVCGLLMSGKFGKVPYLFQNTGLFEEIFSIVSFNFRSVHSKRIVNIRHQFEIDVGKLNEELTRNDNNVLKDLIAGRGKNTKILAKIKLMSPSVADSLEYTNPCLDLAASVYFFRNVTCSGTFEENLISIGCEYYDFNGQSSQPMSQKSKQKFLLDQKKRFNLKDILEKVEFHTSKVHYPLAFQEVVNTFLEFAKKIGECEKIPTSLSNYSISRCYKFETKISSLSDQFKSLAQQVWGEKEKSFRNVAKFRQLITDIGGIDTSLMKTLELGAFTPLQLVSMANNAGKSVNIYFHTEEKISDLMSGLVQNFCCHNTYSCKWHLVNKGMELKTTKINHYETRLMGNMKISEIKGMLKAYFFSFQSWRPAILEYISKIPLNILDSIEFNRCWTIYKCLSEEKNDSFDLLSVYGGNLTDIYYQQNFSFHANKHCAYFKFGNKILLLQGDIRDQREINNENFYKVLDFDVKYSNLLLKVYKNVIFCFLPVLVNNTSVPHFLFQVKLDREMPIKFLHKLHLEESSKHWQNIPGFVITEENELEYVTNALTGFKFDFNPKFAFYSDEIKLWRIRDNVPYLSSPSGKTMTAKQIHDLKEGEKESEINKVDEEKTNLLKAILRQMKVKEGKDDEESVEDDSSIFDNLLQKIGDVNDFEFDDMNFETMFAEDNQNENQLAHLNVQEEEDSDEGEVEEDKVLFDTVNDPMEGTVNKVAVPDYLKPLKECTDDLSRRLDRRMFCFPNIKDVTTFDSKSGPSERNYIFLDLPFIFENVKTVDTIRDHLIKSKERHQKFLSSQSFTFRLGNLVIKHLTEEQLMATNMLYKNNAALYDLGKDRMDIGESLHEKILNLNSTKSTDFIIIDRSPHFEDQKVIKMGDGLNDFEKFFSVLLRWPHRTLNKVFGLRDDLRLKANGKPENYGVFRFSFGKKQFLISREIKEINKSFLDCYNIYVYDAYYASNNWRTKQVDDILPDSFHETLKEEDYWLLWDNEKDMIEGIEHHLRTKLISPDFYPDIEVECS